jgi:hypothetical protein
MLMVVKRMPTVTPSGRVASSRYSNYSMSLVSEVWLGGQEAHFRHMLERMWACARLGVVFRLFDAHEAALSAAAGRRECPHNIKRLFFKLCA